MATLTMLLEHDRFHHPAIVVRHVAIGTGQLFNFPARRFDACRVEVMLVIESQPAAVEPATLLKHAECSCRMPLSDLRVAFPQQGELRMACRPSVKRLHHL